MLQGGQHSSLLQAGCLQVNLAGVGGEALHIGPHLLGVAGMVQAHILGAHHLGQQVVVRVVVQRRDLHSRSSQSPSGVCL